MQLQKTVNSLQLIKLRPGVTQEQQKAIDFFNRYNKQQEQAEQMHTAFKQRTKELFGENFKGFDFEVGGKKYKYNIKPRCSCRKPIKH